MYDYKSQWLLSKNNRLVFKLIEHVSAYKQGSFTFLLNNYSSFNLINIKGHNDIKWEIEGVENFKLNTEGSVVVPASSSLKLAGTLEKESLINLKDLEIETLATYDESNWISKNFKLDRVYSNITLVVEHIIPNDYDLEIYLSSNYGQVWRKLNFVENTVLDFNTYRSRSVYQVENLSNTVEVYNLDNTSYTKLRNEIKLRINLKSVDGVASLQLPKIYNLKVFAN